MSDIEVIEYEPYKGFRQDMERLASLCPLRDPVKIHLTAPPTPRGRKLPPYADCARMKHVKGRKKGKKSWRLRIDMDGGKAVSRDSLIHEWAHALCEDREGPIGGDDHGPGWGTAYARAYRAVIEGK